MGSDKRDSIHESGALEAEPSHSKQTEPNESPSPITSDKTPPVYSESDSHQGPRVRAFQHNPLYGTASGRVSLSLWRDANEQLLTAVRQGQEDVVISLTESGLVDANTTTPDGETPLLAAVTARDINMVERLLMLGADRNAFGKVSKDVHDAKSDDSRQRTPLQLAASTGQLVLVKKLIEQYHCDDSLIAPDGQIALRLAAKNGHREIVQYLPSRRSGGFKRWKHKNRRALAKAKRACSAIYKFFKFLLWDIEKAFFWTVPKHVIVKPLDKACRWCWKHRREFGPWCKAQVLKVPGFAKECGKALAKLPRWIWKAAIKTCKWLWEFMTKTFPRFLKYVAKWAWQMLTVKIPKALSILGQWIWKGVRAVSRAVWNASLRMMSWLATLATALITFFQQLTLRDIWNGFVDVLHAIFVTFPKVLGSWIEAFGDASYKIMKKLFGDLGTLIWYLFVGLKWLVMFLPKQVWDILKSIGDTMQRGGHEIHVWFNPKAK